MQFERGGINPKSILSFTVQDQKPPTAFAEDYEIIHGQYYLRSFLKISG